MKIQLDYDLKIKIMEAGKEKETLSVLYREYTKKEKKELETDVKKFKKIYNKLDKIERKLKTTSKKVLLFEQNKKPAKALEEIEKQEKLEDELDIILQELDKYGEQDGFYEIQAKKKFNLLIKGPGKDKLAGIADRKGYVTIVALLDREKDNLEKKQSGESQTA